MTQHQARLRAPADIGLALQQARLTQGLTQHDVASALDVAQSAISDIESGKSTIYLRRILEFARLTGIQLTATWTDDDADR